MLVRGGYEGVDVGKLGEEIVAGSSQDRLDFGGSVVGRQASIDPSHHILAQLTYRPACTLGIQGAFMR